MLAPDSVLRGRFVLREALAGEGHRLVYRAEDRERPGSQFVIKQLQLPGGGAGLKCTVEEAAILLCSLAHPALPRYDSCWEEDNCGYLVMNCLEGQPLDEVVDHYASVGGRPAVAEAVGWALQIASGLRYLHDQDLIHGRLEPDNVLQVAEGRVVLLGFGLDQVLIDAPVAKGVYSAPEQFELGAEVDHRCDIYAVGALLYYFLTGEPPPPGQERSQAFEVGARDPLGPMNERNPKVSPALEAVIRQMLEVHPTDRHESIDAVMKAIEEAAASELKSSSGTLPAFVDDRSADRLPVRDRPPRSRAAAAKDSGVPSLKVKKVVVPPKEEPKATPSTPAAPDKYAPTAFAPGMKPPPIATPKTAKDFAPPPPIVRPDAEPEPDTSPYIFGPRESAGGFIALYVALSVLGWWLGTFAMLLLDSYKLTGVFPLWTAALGLTLGFAQAFSLNRYYAGSINWIFATAVGFFIYGMLVTVVGPGETGLMVPSTLLVFLAVSGFALGLAQYWALQPQLEGFARWQVVTVIGMLATFWYFRSLPTLFLLLAHQTPSSLLMNALTMAWPGALVMALAQAVCLSAHSTREQRVP
jgi:serine/threonine-protein kinase